MAHVPLDGAILTKDQRCLLGDVATCSTTSATISTCVSTHRRTAVLIQSGLGLIDRELIDIYSSDIVIAAARERSENSIAYEHGKLISGLTATGGITTTLSALEASGGQQTGPEVVYDDDPARLVEPLLERYTSGGYVCPMASPGSATGRGICARRRPWRKVLIVSGRSYDPANHDD